MILSPSELERYEKQMLISGWGAKGQGRLKDAKVAVVGVGGLGCPATMYLAAAGIGKVTLIDGERFELGNLNRQILGWQEDIRRFKVEAAKEKIEKLNSAITVEAKSTQITQDNVDDVMGIVDVVVDGQDNWKTRFIINDYCVSQGVPFVHAGVSAFHGQMTTIMPGEGPCLRCIFPEDPPEAEEIPVLGATPAFFAALEVMETIKLITGIGSPLIGRMLLADGKEMAFETVEMRRNVKCPVCAQTKSPKRT